MSDSTNLSSFGFQGNSMNDFTNSEEMSQPSEVQGNSKEVRSNSERGIPRITVDPTKNPTPMFRYAMLELVTARNIRESATSLMNSIADTQREQKAASSYLDQFRKHQSDVSQGHGSGSQGKWERIQQWQIDWLKSHNIKYPSKVDTGDTWLNADEWDLICKGTQAYIDNIGSSTQQKMVQAQDALGQYNAQVQGATSSITNDIELSRSVNTTQPF